MKRITGTVEDIGTGNDKIYTDRGGRMVCLVCNSTDGFKIITRYSHKEKQFHRHLTCVHCGSKESVNGTTGEIIKQKIERVMPVGIWRILSNQEAFK